MSIVDTAQTAFQIGPRSNGMLMDSADFDQLPDEYWDPAHRYELFNGVLIVSPPAGPKERGPNALLSQLLFNYRDDHPQGDIMDDALPEQDIQCGDDRRRADHAIWIGLGRAPDPLEDVPTIAVEFVSGRSRDRQRDYVEKRKEYALAGVEEYWVIDRFRREMSVFRGARVDNEVIVISEEQGVYETPMLPGFELPLVKLLAKADQYKDAQD